MVIFVAELQAIYQGIEDPDWSTVLSALYNDLAIRFLRGRAGDAVQVVLPGSRKLRVVNAACRLIAMMDEAAGTLAQAHWQMPGGQRSIA
jgi:hypothetical protein